MSNTKVLYTIGHSNHQISNFINILKNYQITAVADVRSYPFSKYNSEFNRDIFSRKLGESGIKYIYLGNELGGRPKDAFFLENGTVNFEKLIASETFISGIHRLLQEMDFHRMVILCSEREPIDCHRAVVISHYLHKKIGIEIRHILYNGTLEDHRDTEKRILEVTNIKPTLFNPNPSFDILIDEAFRIRAQEIAYKEKREESKSDENNAVQRSSKIMLFTIGFTQKDAQTFFESLKRNKILHLIDIRLNNNSQLAGFTKKEDLKYFLREIANIKYSHYPELAPTKEMLNKYKKKEIDWKEYEYQYINLMKKRKIENLLKNIELDHSCLLCSEPEADHCHRRLLAEYLKTIFPEIEIYHL